MKQETILVIDDNKEIVYSLGKLLTYEGYRVVEAYDGMEALEALEKNTVDLILPANLDCLVNAFFCFEFLTTCSIKDGASPMNNFRDTA